MLKVSDNRLQYLVAEDVPYIDLTTHVLGISNETGQMEYYSREACLVCGAEEVARIAQMEGCETETLLASGEFAEPGETILRVRGKAGDLHRVWKVGLNLLDHLSAVATRTRAMVEAAHAANPRCEVLVTRKSMPGCKDLLVKAAMTGGAFPHRLGLSETVLVFEHHLEFLGGFDEFVRRLPDFRSKCIEKKLFVEADARQALILAAAGVDGIQFDKIPASELAPLVKELRGIDPHITLVAAGGINPENATEYATTGVDGLATTAVFTARPLDMSVRMSR